MEDAASFSSPAFPQCFPTFNRLTCDLNRVGVKLKDLEIGICQLSDIPALQEFIHRFVREEHILSISRELLCWLHENRTEKQLNFFIAKRPDSKEIIGIVGFTPFEHFDPELRPQQQRRTPDGSASVCCCQDVDGWHRRTGDK